jgi:cytochrome c-type biogenesis protein CcmH/NrfG
MAKQKTKRKAKHKTKTKLRKKIKSNLFYYYVVCVLVALISLTFFNLSVYLSPAKTQVILGSQATTDNYSGQLIYWESILSENPDYIEGWIELAKMKSTKGDTIGAQQAIDMARKIDPNRDRLEEISKN